MRLAETVTVGGGGLSRSAHLRADPTRMADALADGRVLALWRGKVLMAAGAPGWLPPDHPVLQGEPEPVFLGENLGTFAFATDISAWEPPADNAPLIQAVADANTMRGIKTFVIGSPGSEPARGALSQMATQGGTAPPGCSDMGPNYCHFDMTTAPDLSAALNEAFKAITGSVITCNYTIPPPSNGMVVDPKLVNVTFTSSSGSNTIAKDPDPPGGACNQGWQYNANSTQIQLCPDTCNLVKADPNAKIEVVLGCSTMVR